jgi:hypothetical protein
VKTYLRPLWYDAQREGLNEELYPRIEETLTAITERPTSFPIVRKDARRALVKQFPYAIYFRILPDHILVFAIVHTSRAPRVWRRRI